tara:strand:- start:933 stop:1211 length:279 start_codon:yes stop_codon:yes gene_type:complete
MSIIEIKEAVENQLQIDLNSRLRDRRHADARALYYRLSKDLTTSTLYVIGKEVDRDHSSVLHGLNNIFRHVDQNLYKKMKSDLYGIYSSAFQ